MGQTKACDIHWWLQTLRYEVKYLDIHEEDGMPTVPFVSVTNASNKELWLDQGLRMRQKFPDKHDIAIALGKRLPPKVGVLATAAIAKRIHNLLFDALFSEAIAVIKELAELGAGWVAIADLEKVLSQKDEERDPYGVLSPSQYFIPQFEHILARIHYSQDEEGLLLKGQKSISSQVIELLSSPDSELSESKAYTVVGQHYRFICTPRESSRCNL